MKLNFKRTMALLLCLVTILAVSPAFAHSKKPSNTILYDAEFVRSVEYSNSRQEIEIGAYTEDKAEITYDFVKKGSTFTTPNRQTMYVADNGVITVAPRFVGTMVIKVTAESTKTHRKTYDTIIFTCRPWAPTLVKVSSKETGKADVTFKSVPKATAYMIVYSKTSTFENYQVANFKPEDPSASVYTYQLTGLKASDNLFFRVVASSCDGAVLSSPSNIIKQRVHSFLPIRYFEIFVPGIKHALNDRELRLILGDKVYPFVGSVIPRSFDITTWEVHSYDRSVVQFRMTPRGKLILTAVGIGKTKVSITAYGGKTISFTVKVGNPK